MYIVDRIGSCAVEILSALRNLFQEGIVIDYQVPNYFRACGRRKIFQLPVIAGGAVARYIYKQADDAVIFQELTNLIFAVFDMSFSRL